MKKIKFHHSINTKIIFVIVTILIFALEFIGANFITQIEQHFVSNFQEDRQTQMEFLKGSIRPYLELQSESNPDTNVNPQEEINELVTDFSGTGITELQVIDSNFIILSNSDSTQQNLVGQISNETDVRNAFLQGQTVTSQIVDSATGQRRYKITEPVRAQTEDAPIIGVVTMESNIETVYQQIEEITWVFLQSSFIAILVSLILANLVSRALTKPIIEMQEQTLKIAGGDYSGSINVYGEDELGQLASLINNLADDVSDAQESIESERRRLDGVLTNMTDGVIATDRRGLITTINSMAETFLDVDGEETKEKSIVEVLNLEEELSVREIIETEDDMLINGSNIEGPIVLRASFSLIQRESGFISGLVCVLHDVTEQERIEEERKEFVSNVSHELRTPLTSLRSYTEALMDGAWKDPELAPRFIEVTQNETDRMIRMIQDLLHLSRIDSGKSSLELEIIDLDEMFGYVLNRFDMLLKSEEYENKSYKIERELLDEPVFAEIDPDRIMQVMDNLINNAIKYSPDGGTITGKMKTVNDKVVITVTDEGMGIPKKDLNKIFNRFYRVDRARSRAMGGSGLGLAISKEVVEQHGGNIWASSEEGVGTTFYLSLPYVPYEEEDEWG